MTAAGSPISGELASLVNEIRQAKADDEVGKAIADGVAKELASGKYVSKEKADARAESEYKQFEATRRAYIEAESEREIIEELEETAKQLPPPPESDEAP